MVITMGNGINNGLTHGIGWKFISSRCGDAVGAGADGPVDLRKNEIAGLIYLFKKVPCVYLLGCKRPSIHGAVAMNAFGFGRAVEALGIDPEKQCRGVGWFPIFQQI